MIPEAVVAITNCFSQLYSRVQADFVDRLPGCHKSRGEGLSLIASVVLNTQSVNLMENAAALPRDIGSVDHRYQYISRVSSNSRIDADEVMCAYAGELFRRLHDAGETIVPALDQSRVNKGHEAYHPSIYPHLPELVYFGKARERPPDGAQACLEEGTQGSSSFPDPLFSPRCATGCSSFAPVETAQYIAIARTSMSRSNRSGFLIRLRVMPKPRVLKSENIASMLQRIP